MTFRWNTVKSDGERIGYQILRDIYNRLCIITEWDVLSTTEQLPFEWDCLSKKYESLNSTFIGSFEDADSCYSTLSSIVQTKFVVGMEKYSKVTEDHISFNLPNGNEYKIVRGGTSTNKTMGGDVSYDESNDFDDFVIDSPTGKAISQNKAESNDTHTHEGIDESIETLKFYREYQPLFDFIQNCIQVVLEDYTTVY